MCNKCIELEKTIGGLQEEVTLLRTEKEDVLNSISGDINTLKDMTIELKNMGEETREQIKRLDYVVFGSEDLNVRPMRDMLDDIYTAYSRAKWAAGAFGITNLGTLVAFISWLLSKGTP